MSIVARIIGRHTERVFRRHDTDAVLITHVAVWVAVLAVGAQFLL
jgi:hypothetical protein